MTSFRFILDSNGSSILFDFTEKPKDCTNIIQCASKLLIFLEYVINWTSAMESSFTVVSNIEQNSYMIPSFAICAFEAVKLFYMKKNSVKRNSKKANLNYFS